VANHSSHRSGRLSKTEVETEALIKQAEAHGLFIGQKYEYNGGNDEQEANDSNAVIAVSSDAMSLNYEEWDSNHG